MTEASTKMRSLECTLSLRNNMTNARSPLQALNLTDYSQCTSESLKDLPNMSSNHDQNSLLIHYMNSEDEPSSIMMPTPSDDGLSICTPSLCSEEESDIESNKMKDLPSVAAIKSIKTPLSDEAIHNEDTAPKSFLQLKGIVVGKFNMGCNFHISAALQIMIQDEIYILSIQEHMPWNTELSEV